MPGNMNKWMMVNPHTVCVCVCVACVWCATTTTTTTTKERARARVGRMNKALSCNLIYKCKYLHCLYSQFRKLSGKYSRNFVIGYSGNIQGIQEMFSDPGISRIYMNTLKQIHGLPSIPMNEIRKKSWIHISEFRKIHALNISWIASWIFPELLHELLPELPWNFRTKMSLLYNKYFLISGNSYGTLT